MRFILSFFIVLMITGCSIMPTNEANYKTPDGKAVFNNLNTTIIDLATQLFNSNIYKKNSKNIVLTSFVDLNKFDETSVFGRLLSESMFNELHIRKFKVTDFRGQDAVLVNEDGEFHLTRDTEKLRDMINGVEFILVGTYVKFENQSILINARIIDSISGEVISSARSVYKPKDCQIFGICKNKIIETEQDILDKQQEHIYQTSDYPDTNDDSKYDEESTIMPDTKMSK